MTKAVFLSASVPDPKRTPKYAETADSVAITAAVTALVYVTLGRRPLVWGGHPAITPMIWVIAESMGVDYGRWVKLYQSEYFQDEFPEDNRRFQNVIFTASVNGDRLQSLRHMRDRMFREQEFDAAVFIGGMEGILDEFELIKSAQPNSYLLPVISTGGAAADLAERGYFAPELRDDMDYVSLFHRQLHIAPQERRYRVPEEQPVDIEDRLWTAENPTGSFDIGI